MTFEIQAVARTMDAVGDAPAGRASGWSVDTRTQNAGDVYFALRGPNFDGHSFLKDAQDKRAAALVVERPGGMAGELVVQDTLCALQKLGAWARGAFVLQSPQEAGRHQRSFCHERRWRSVPPDSREWRGKLRHGTFQRAE